MEWDAHDQAGNHMPIKFVLGLQLQMVVGHRVDTRVKEKAMVP